MEWGNSFFHIHELSNLLTITWNEQFISLKKRNEFNAVCCLYF